MEGQQDESSSAVANFLTAVYDRKNALFNEISTEMGSKVEFSSTQAEKWIAAWRDLQILEDLGAAMNVASRSY